MLILWYNSFVFDLVSSRCDHWSLMGIKSNVLQLLDAFTSFTPGLLTSHTKYRRSNAKLCSENLKICLLVKPRQFCDHHIISSSFLTHKINKIWRKKNSDKDLEEAVLDVDQKVFCKILKQLKYFGFICFLNRAGMPLWEVRDKRREDRRDCD